MPPHTPFVALSKQNLVRLSSQDPPLCYNRKQARHKIHLSLYVRHGPAMELLIACGSSNSKISDDVQQRPQVNESPAGIASRNISALLFSHEGEKAAILEGLDTLLNTYLPEEQVKRWQT